MGLTGGLATLATTFLAVITVPGAHVTGADRHGASLLLLGAAAIVLLLGSLRGSTPATAGLVAVGVAVLAIAVASDLPHVHDTGSVGDIAHVQRASPGVGYYAETAGGVLLLLAGGGLLLVGGPADPAGRRARPGVS